MTNAGRILLWGALGWLVLVGITAVTLWPLTPSTTTGWIVFAIVAPPLLVLGELILNGFGHPVLDD